MLPTASLDWKRCDLGGQPSALPHPRSGKLESAANLPAATMTYNKIHSLCTCCLASHGAVTAACPVSWLAEIPHQAQGDRQPTRMQIIRQCYM